MVSSKKLTTIEIFFIFILCTLFYVAGILVIYFTTIYKSDNVPYTQCNAALGEFALEHGAVASSIKFQCGPNGDQICSTSANNFKRSSRLL